MNQIKKLILSSILVGFVSCSTHKKSCDAYHSGNPHNGKKPYFLRKK
jgi:hypothetical protein